MYTKRTNSIEIPEGGVVGEKPLERERTKAARLKIENLALILRSNHYNLKKIPKFFLLEKEILENTKWEENTVSSRVQSENYFLKLILENSYFSTTCKKMTKNNCEKKDLENYMYFFEYRFRILFQTLGVKMDNAQEGRKTLEILSDIRDMLTKTFSNIIIEVHENYQVIDKILSLLKKFVHFYNTKMNEFHSNHGKKSTFNLFGRQKIERFMFKKTVALWMSQGVEKILSSFSISEKYFFDEIIFLQKNVDHVTYKHIGIFYSDLLLRKYIQNPDNISKFTISTLNDLSKLFGYSKSASGNSGELFHRCDETAKKNVDCFIKIYKNIVLPSLKSRISTYIQKTLKLETGQQINSFNLHSQSCKEIIEILFRPVRIIFEIEKNLSLTLKRSMFSMFFAQIFQVEIKKYLILVQNKVQREIVMSRKKKRKNKKEKMEISSVICTYMNNVQEVKSEIKNIFLKKKNYGTLLIIEEFFDFINKVRNKIAVNFATWILNETKVYIKHSIMRKIGGNDDVVTDTDVLADILNEMFFELSERLIKRMLHLILKHLFNLYVKEILKILFNSKEKTVKDFAVLVGRSKTLVKELKKVFICEGKGVSEKYVQNSSEKLSVIYNWDGIKEC